MLLIYILVLLFILLIGYQFILEIFPQSLVEGLENADTNTVGEQEYKPYNVSDPNNSLILAKQNSGNI